MRPILYALALSLLAFPALATESVPVSISKAYSFAVPEGAKAAVVFMTVTYPAVPGEVVPDRILRVETQVAERAELHTAVIENDVMMMRPVDSFPLPPTGNFMLKPQGAHIMLMEMKQPLVKGERFPLTVVFEKAGPVQTEIDIRAPGDHPSDEPASPKVEEPPEEAEIHDHHHH